MGVGVLTKIQCDVTPGLVKCFAAPPEFDSIWWLLVAPEAYHQPRVRDFVTFAASRIRQDMNGMRS
jgi:hypothetical protein